MIAKTLFFTKILCTYSMSNLRQEKSHRDHETFLNAEMSKYVMRCACGGVRRESV